MVEILRRGQVPDEKTYTASCRCCGSLLRFKGAEATTYSDQRDGDYVAVTCPVCDYMVTASKAQPSNNLGGWKD